jgi:chromosome segregation ATPase
MSDETPTETVPVSSETTALDVLQRQVESLTDRLEKITSERDEFSSALRTLSTERDDLLAQVAAPDAQAARISELEASIRDRQHFDKFAELAKGAKAKDKALRQLWRDAKDRGYQPESDDVDAKALEAIVAKLKTEVDYAFDPESTDTTRAAQEAARTTSRTKYGLEMRGEEPAGGGRNERNKGADGTIVTQEMRADPKFMLDPKNKEIIRDAALGGRFR